MSIANSDRMYMVCDFRVKEYSESLLRRLRRVSSTFFRLVFLMLFVFCLRLCICGEKNEAISGVKRKESNLSKKRLRVFCPRIILECLVARSMRMVPQRRTAVGRNHVPDG